MRVVGRNKLDAFCERHADARKWIEAWLHDTEEVKWLTPQHVKDRYSSASFLANSIVVFNVKGNSYRMEVLVAYKVGVVTIDWIGTHRQYDERNERR